MAFLSKDQRPDLPNLELHPSAGKFQLLGPLIKHFPRSLLIFDRITFSVKIFTALAWQQTTYKMIFIRYFTIYFKQIIIAMMATMILVLKYEDSTVDHFIFGCMKQEAHDSKSSFGI